MSGFGILLRQRLRRDRVQLLLWIVGTALLALFAASASVTTYGNDAERAQLVGVLVHTPAILMLRGLPQGVSLNAFVFLQIFVYLALLAGLMSTFLAVRHTRAEEESGRAELIGATPVARATPTLATLAHGVIANALMALGVFAGLVAGGVEPGGSMLAGLATGGTGLAFVGVGVLAAQVARSSRAANTLGVASVLVAFVLRGLGAVFGTVDASGTTMTAAWPTWASPIGWGEETSPFSSPRAWPLVLDVALFAACAVVVLALLRVRDSGASILAERRGRSAARASLSGSVGLAWRLQWPTVIAWGLGGALCGVFAGSLNGLVQAVTSGNPSLGTTISSLASSSSASVSQALVAGMFSLAGALAAACATQAIIRVRQEEVLGTAELLLAARVSKTRLLLSYLFVGTVAIVIVLAAAVVAAVLSAAAAGDAAVPAHDVLATGVAALPAALVYLGLAALLFVLVPRATIAVAWAALAAGIFLGTFGGILGVPQWVRDLSPFAHTPVVGTSSTDWSGAIGMAAIALVVVAVSLLLLRRREWRAS